MPKETFFNLPENKRTRIIDSAILQFSKTHYKKVTIDSIVNTSGIPKGSFYQYFINKDDLYTFIFSQIGDQKKQVLEDLHKHIDYLDFKEYFLKTLAKAQNFENSDMQLIELKNKFINECPQEVRKAVLKNEIPKSYKLMEQIISSYVEKGELRKDLNIKTAAYMITSCIVSLENYQFDEEYTMDETMIQIIDILIKGFK